MSTLSNPPGTALSAGHAGKRAWRPAGATLALVLTLGLAGAAVHAWRESVRTDLDALTQRAAGHDETARRTLRWAGWTRVPGAAGRLGEALVQDTDAAMVRQGLSALEAAAQQGDGRAALVLGKTLWRGAAGQPASPEQAEPWLSTAWAQGQTAAAHYLALIAREQRPGHAPDPRAAGDWMLRAAQAGHADSQFLYAQMLMHGDLGKPDPEAARDWLERAAEQEQPEANLALLMARQRGELGLKADAEAEAHQWREAAHSLRHRPSPP